MKENPPHDGRFSAAFPEKKKSSLLDTPSSSGKDLPLQRKINEPLPISEELKREMLGDEFTIRFMEKRDLQSIQEPKGCQEHL